MRYQISLLGDGKVSKGEDIWDACPAEAENTALCLGISFASVRVFCFCVLGAMPDMHGHVSAGSVSDTSWALGWKVLWVASLACMFLGLGFFKLRHELYSTRHEEMKGNQSPKSSSCGQVSMEDFEDNDRAHATIGMEGFEDNDTTRTTLVPRCLIILAESFIMCFSWGMLYCATAFLNANLERYRYQLMGHIIIALAISGMCCVVIVFLDKVADFLRMGSDADEIVHIIHHIIETHGLLVGISWEICFKVSAEVIGINMQAMGKNVAVGFGTCLCLVVVPAYRMYMIPELEKRRRCLSNRCA